MPDRRSIFRLLALAGFLLTVALALWLAEVRPLVVIVVMALALAVAWAVEWLSWRQESVPALADAPATSEESPHGAAALPEAVPASPAPAVVLPPTLEAPATVEAQTPGPFTPPAPAVASPPPVAEPVEPEPVASPAPPPPPPPAPVPEPPPRPPLRPVPPPEPEPEPSPVPLLPPPVQPPPAAEPERPAAQAGVVDLRTRVTLAPRRWNLWDLERRARDEQQRDPARYEEWSYLFVHLRQFATPDGSLPTEFDGLVRESFGELLEYAG